MHKLTVMVLVWVVVASTAAAQSLSVDQHGKILPKNIDHVTVTLSGFSADASSATVTMIGEHQAGVPEDGPLCRAIRPASVEVSLSDGEGSAVWNFSNRFDGRYRLRCRIRADDGTGTTTDGRIQTIGGEHRMTLDPAQVAPNATTSVEVAVWIAGGYSNGTQVDFSLRHWTDVPVVAGCAGVTPAPLNLELVERRMRGTWDVMTTDPVECPVRFDDPDFEASATLSVVADLLDFAHFANGNGITSDLVLVNVAPRPLRPAIYFYDQQGHLIDPDSVVDVTGDLAIQEDGALTVLTEMEPLGELTVSTHGRGDLVSGSVKVVSDGPIGGGLRYNFPAIGEAVVGASPPVRDVLFPVRRREGGITTGVALHNLESSPGLVRCDLLREGVLRDSASIPLEANGQTSWLIDQAFPAADTSDFAGSVRCDAVGQGLFSVVALEMDPGTRIFTTLPVVPVPERTDRE